jgi:chromosome partitioning protein
MKVVVVANPKGGVGKSTLSTNLAGYFAARGESVMLGDMDRQHSSREWLALRPAALPSIRGWDIQGEGPARPPKGTQRVVLDTPAGLHGKNFDRALKEAHRIIVPVQPSLFDILATRRFLTELAEEKAVRRGELEVAVVGMRVDSRTRSAQELERFLQGFGLPVLGFLRDTQVYVQLAARGLTLFDVNRRQVEKDLEQWQDLLDWDGG